MNETQFQVIGMVAAALIQAGVVDLSANDTSQVPPHEDAQLIKLRKIVQRVMTVLTSDPPE